MRHTQAIERDARPARSRFAMGVSAPNLVLLAIAISITILQYGAFPVLFGHSTPVLCVLILLVAVSTPLHWGLVHESFHGHLGGTAAQNQALGRLLAIPLLMCWDTIRFGHLTHHDSNRHTLDRPEVRPPGSSWIGSAGPYFFKLLGGHALISMAASLAILLPVRTTHRVIDWAGSSPEMERVRLAALKVFGNEARRSRIRTDLLAAALLGVIACCAWGPTWPAFLGCALGRYCVLSVLDNSHHYGTPLDSGHDARNTWLPRWGEWLVLSHNLHGLHHASPVLDWRELRAAFHRARLPYEGGWVRCLLRQFRGPLRAEDLGF